MAKIKVTQEKELIIGMIVSTDFLTQIAPLIQLNQLQATSSKTVAKWCMEYYATYKTAPQEFIQDIYNQYKKQLSEDDAIIIAKTLTHISEKYEEKEKYNVPYMIDKANDYLRERRLITLQEQLEHDVTLGRLDKAENAIVGYNKIAKTVRKETNIWTNTQVVQNILNEDTYKLFRFPGAVGELMGYYRRSNLYAYAGVAKRGKSRWLMQTAVFASINKLNTMVVSLEMDDEEANDMLFKTMIRKPSGSEENKSWVLPSFSDDNNIVYTHTTIDTINAYDYNRWQRKGSIQCSPIEVITGEPNSMTLDDLENEILALELYKGFVPDIIIIDYADIIAGKGYDSRDRVNNIWIGLKALAKKYHAVVFTATHMNSEALKKDGEGYNIGEDRRKLNHVAGMYILNQSEQEKKDRVMRVKATATRFGEHTELDEVVVLYDYGVGRTYIDSRFKKDIPNYTEKGE